MMRVQTAGSVAVAFATMLSGASACGGESDSLATKALHAAIAVASSDQDPCTLLAANEAEKYIGPLSTPPYRSEDGRATKSGEECTYRARDKQIEIKPTFHGGADVGSIVEGAPKVLGALLDKAAPGMSGMSGKVMQDPGQGPWDHATWIPSGGLLVRKGDAAVMIDIAGASGNKTDALELAKLVIPRIGHPLSYDGAKAVALAPKPVKAPKSACDFVPRAAVEAAIGTLAGTPQVDAAGTLCTYVVHTAEGTRRYPVEYVWEGGNKNYNMLKNNMATVGGIMGGPTSMPDLDSVGAGNPQMKQMIGGIMKMVGGGDRSNATGATSKVGFKTDTTLTGPWDKAALLHGTQLIAVRNDVFIGMSLESADYERAKALLAAIASRL